MFQSRTSHGFPGAKLLVMDTSLTQHHADQQKLGRLNAAHAGRWKIWRSRDEYGRPAAWIASNTGVPGASATLHAATAAELEALLAAPPPGAGLGLPRPAEGGAR